MTVHGVFNKGHLSKTELSPTKDSTEYTPSVSKIRHRKLECCQDWVWTSIQEERSKTTKWTVSGRAEMFPMNGFNWSEGDQAVSAAGIPVPLFAAWLASKYILTSVSSSLQFAAISMVMTEMTAGSDRPDHNPMLSVVMCQCTDCWHNDIHTQTMILWTGQGAILKSNSKTTHPTHNGINICS